MRLFITLILLLFNIAFTSAQTYTFDMYETTGGDCTIVIDLSRNFIKAKTKEMPDDLCVFFHNLSDCRIDDEKGIVGFSFSHNTSVKMRPDHGKHYFLIRKDAIFCSSNDGSHEFYFKPINLDVYLFTYQQLIYDLSSRKTQKSQLVNPGYNLTFTVDGVTFTMVHVPGGTFTMGATSEQGSDALDDEKPTHNVTLNSYHIGQTEVTQALWKAVMGSNPSCVKGDRRPVVNVSWNDCQTFISRLNAKTCKQFRLPTEAEWEYAARGGHSGGYKYAGSDNIDNVAWYWDNYDEGGIHEGGIHNVATKSPNILGIYDMSGNVCEWCHDWFANYDTLPETNPKGQLTGTNRVIRGGCWIWWANGCRISNRDGASPFRSFDTIGLRLAL